METVTITKELATKTLEYLEIYQMILENEIANVATSCSMSKRAMQNWNTLRTELERLAKHREEFTNSINKE